MSTALILLAAAVAVEVFSTASLPRTEGFTHPLWTGVVLAGYGIAIWLLALVVRTIPVSTTYAMWSGLGVALVALIGYTVLGEEMSWLKAASLAMVVIGVIGLNLAGTH